MLRLLAEGHLAGVVLGDARARISETWGEPTDWSAKARERAKIWCYGEIEVYFDPADTVWLIHSDRGAMSMWEGSGDARVDPWVIAPTLLTRDLERALDAMGVTHERRPGRGDPEVARVVANGALEFGFESRPEGAEPTLAYWSWSRAEP